MNVISDHFDAFQSIVLRDSGDDTFRITTMEWDYIDGQQWLTVAEGFTSRYEAEQWLHFKKERQLIREAY